MKLIARRPKKEEKKIFKIFLAEHIKKPKKKTSFTHSYFFFFFCFYFWYYTMYYACIQCMYVYLFNS